MGSESFKLVQVRESLLRSLNLTLMQHTVNSESLEVSYVDLLQKMPTLAWFLVLAPAEMLAIFDPVAHEVMTIYFPAYERIHSEIHVRITELPASATLRDLRNAQLNALVRVREL